MRLHLSAEDASLYLQDSSSRAVTRIPAATKELLRVKVRPAAGCAAAVRYTLAGQLGWPLPGSVCKEYGGLATCGRPAVSACAACVAVVSSLLPSLLAAAGQCAGAARGCFGSAAAAGGGRGGCVSWQGAPICHQRGLAAR